MSRIISLNIPSVLDLRQGQIDAIFAASVQDPDGVRQVVVYYDRPLATASGSYNFQIIHGWGDAWTDGNHSYTASILPHNVPATLNITHVEIEDNQGNRTTVPAQALRDLGVDTSITVRSVDPDLTPPVLTQLVLPDVIDVTTAHVVAEFAASARDQTQIADVVIWFDRDLNYTFGTNDNGTFYDFSLTGLYGYGADDWSDGRSTQQLLVSGANASGTVMVDRVEVTDIYGNQSVYTNQDLRRLGFDTSFDIIGTAAPALTTYVAEFPDVITLREGQRLEMPLRFVGMTNHWISYEYSVSPVGGTASASDIGVSAGSGGLSVNSTSPISDSTIIPITAIRDSFAEPTETAYLTVRLSGNMTFEDGGTLRVIQINILDDNRVTGGHGHDALYGTSAAEILTGGRGNDRYFITAGDRVVELANEGNDTVVTTFTYSLTGHVEDLILTGSANLTGTGNTLANRLTGNTGSNTLDGGLGADTLAGGAGNDIYIVDNLGDRVVEAANSGTDTVRASVSQTLGANIENLILTGSGNLTGTGNTLANQLTGNAGNNILNGGLGSDTLDGGAGNDALFGGAGNDRLSGGFGNDRLVGGVGKDYLSGGAGADRFVFLSRSDTDVGFAGRDIIADFNRGQGDRIDLSSMDANERIGGDQAFDFLGTSNFTGSAGEVRFANSNGVTLLYGDVDGDRRADFSIEFSRQITLFEQDFLL